MAAANSSNGGKSQITKLLLIEPFDSLTNARSEDLKGHSYGASRTTARKIGNYLDWIVKDLRLFVSSAGFDYFDFESQMDELSRAIADVEFVTETELNYENFVCRLRFVRQLFQAMITAADKLKRYDRIDRPVHNSIYKMIELKVRVMSLYNVYGVPDVWIYGLANELILLQTIWSGTQEDFKELAGISPGMRQVFQHYSSEAKNALKDLRSQTKKLGY